MRKCLGLLLTGCVGICSRLAHELQWGEQGRAKRMARRASCDGKRVSVDGRSTTADTLLVDACCVMAMRAESRTAWPSDRCA